MRNKTSFTLSVMGIIAGIAGMEHGIGEIWQGNIQPENIVFASWANHPAFQSLAGEPAMSLIPNLLISGIMTIFLSSVFIYWSVKYHQHPIYGVGFMVLSVLLLISGGGFGPPLLGVMLGIFSLISTKKTGTQSVNSRSFKNQLAPYWKPIFLINLGVWIFLCPIFPILCSILHFQDDNLVAFVTPTAFLFLFLSLLVASTQDTINQQHSKIIEKYNG